MIDFKLLSNPEISGAIITLLRAAFENEISDICNFVHRCDENTLEEEMQNATIVSVWSFADGIEEVPMKSGLIKTLAAANQIPTHVILGYHQCDQVPSSSTLTVEHGPQYTASTIYPLSETTYNKLFDLYVNR
jgi:hypothetical protein